MLTTVHTVHKATDIIIKKHKRSAKTSTNAAITRKSFGDEIIKDFNIPTFINDYNMNMNGVNLANQYRETYKTHRPIYRS